MERDVYDQMAARWPSAIVARQQISKFSGGLLNPRTMANMDSRGEGPPREKMGDRIVFYPVSGLVAWLRARVQGQQ